MPAEDLPGDNIHEPGRVTGSPHLAATGELLRERASDLLLISYAITGDQNLALKALRSTFDQGFRHARQSRKAPDFEWACQQAIKQSHSLARSAPPGTLKPASEVDARLWGTLEASDERERLLCALYYVLGWGVESCARALKVGANAVQAQLSIFEKRFNAALRGLPAGQEEIKASLRRRFEPAGLSPSELDEWIEQAQRSYAAEEGAAPKKPTAILALSAVLAALLVVLCLASGWLFFGQGLLKRFQIMQGTAPAPPSVQIRRAAPLRWLSSPEAIAARLRESSQLWRTLWIDVQTSDYGPHGYFGAPRLYRSQAWISLPDQSIELSGLHSQPPSSLHTFSEEHITYFNPFTNLSLSTAGSPAPSTLIQNDTLRQMVFPGAASWAQRGEFRAYDTGQILTIDVLVVDWYNEFGQREARLWVDAQTGLILRSQLFGGDDFNLLVRDSVVTEIQYDQNFPPARLSTEMRSVGSSSPSNTPAPNQPILPTPTPALELSSRQAPPAVPAPAGFDPASSWLVFQFPNNLDATNIQAGTAQVPALIIADGYRTAETKFGLPWMLRCERSPDGYLLVFNTGSDGTSIPDARLRWLDLRDPARVYAPAPELNVQSFAFAANSRRVAAFATTGSAETTGVYLIDLALGESQLVIPLAEASSLVWSPDGESLALLGTVEKGEPLEALLIHVRTGQISFRAALNEPLEQIPPDWPMANWGSPFPRQMGGLEQCAAPPK